MQLNKDGCLQVWLGSGMGVAQWRGLRLCLGMSVTIIEVCTVMFRYVCCSVEVSLLRYGCDNMEVGVPCLGTGCVKMQVGVAIFRYGRDQMEVGVAMFRYECDSMEVGVAVFRHGCD